MNRTRLKNKFLKNRSIENNINYKRQRNYCVSLIRKEKKRFYRNLDTKHITDIRTFWSTVKPSFMDKSNNKQNITLLIDDKIICDKQNIVDSFNKYFSNIVEGLGIYNDFSYLSETKHINDTIFAAICKYENHPSIMLLKENIKVVHVFNFQCIDSEFISIEISKLNAAKSSPLNNIPTKLFKEFAPIYNDIITHIFNESVITSIFPDELKLGDITTTFKKENPYNIKNYRHISLLPVVSKVFERI